MKAVRYKSSDGLRDSGLSDAAERRAGEEPAGRSSIPHGGPWARDAWGYDTFAQFLANRGYAVLQPNFRGSTGYGKKFLDAGNKQWGDKMQDDITWGAKYLVAEGIADPKRVGIMGGSYGGYATLAGVTFTPDLYAAAVRLRRPVKPDHAARNRFRRTGKPAASSSTSAWAIRPRRKARRSSSGSRRSTHADKIKTPLLVVQGAERSAREEARSGSDRDRAARSRLPGRVHRRA